MVNDPGRQRIVSSIGSVGGERVPASLTSISSKLMGVPLPATASPPPGAGRGELRGARRGVLTDHARCAGPAGTFCYILWEKLLSPQFGSRFPQARGRLATIRKSDVRAMQERTDGPVRADNDGTP